MTLAHRTPDASSAKIGGGARWIGIHVTLKNHANQLHCYLSSLSFGPNAMTFARPLICPNQTRSARLWW
jgi:hypothetical protein